MQAPIVLLLLRRCLSMHASTSQHIVTEMFLMKNRKILSTFFRMRGVFEISSQFMLMTQHTLHTHFISELGGHLGISGFKHVVFLCKVMDAG